MSISSAAPGKAESFLDHRMGPMKPNHYVAADSYHRYKEDVDMAAKLKVRVGGPNQSPGLLPLHGFEKCSEPRQALLPKESEVVSMLDFDLRLHRLDMAMKYNCSCKPVANNKRGVKDDF